jgi:Flp pilus assembly protein TadD
VLAREQVKELEMETAQIEAQAAGNPGDAKLQHDLGTLYRQAGRLEDAVEHLSRAVELRPEDPVMLSNLAWLLATNPDESIRDGARAVTLTEKAVKLTGSKRPEPLAFLAAALAEVGRHEDALRAGERALVLAQVMTPPLVVELETRLALHRKGLPIRAGSDR